MNSKVSSDNSPFTGFGKNTKRRLPLFRTKVEDYSLAFRYSAVVLFVLACSVFTLHTKPERTRRIPLWTSFFTSTIFRVLEINTFNMQWGGEDRSWYWLLDMFLIRFLLVELLALSYCSEPPGVEELLMSLHSNKINGLRPEASKKLTG
ncbi:hypothetical protein EJ02DRAFT_458529 [Clathrospora elynae]|uniref:Uncharacterized protein n=1 Tax=Clathrospora elynae TaxID=706981 RepID=A0A6A5SDA7_9PLEO|nr:hypothetical protein EJ02DRAFT_458529 [Clathrospora elynae]